MTAKELLNKLKPLQEKRGAYFNADMSMTMALLESLLITKDRYGYMACPCRLASGSFELDRDIICPCAYRDQDVAEYGACFCGLYVSQDFNQGKTLAQMVPERRPLEKTLAAMAGETKP